MRRVFKAIAVILLTVLVIALLLPVVIPPFLDRTYYTGPKSDHFDGQHFFNPDDPPATRDGAGFSFGRLAKFMLRDKDRAVWPAATCGAGGGRAAGGPPSRARRGAGGRGGRRRARAIAASRRMPRR